MRLLLLETSVDKTQLNVFWAKGQEATTALPQEMFLATAFPA
jgi:hypothetical protein